MASNKHVIEDYQNRQVNSWLVLSYSHTDDKYQQYWNCSCVCSRVFSIRASHVVRGISKGCRFCRNQAAKGPNSPHWKGGTFISSTRLTMIRLCAESRDIPFDLSVEDLEQQWIAQGGICVYSGIPIDLEGSDRTRTEATASLDRIDSSLGYEVGNIQWVHKDVNTMKMDLSESVFLDLCSKIAAHRG